MRDLSLAQLHAVVGGRLRLASLPPRGGEMAKLGRLVTDSRQCAIGDVFWGLEGPNFNGSAFAEQAYARGASGVVVAKRYIQPWPSCWSLEVEDGLAALHRLASWNRRQFRGQVVGVTGSVGKTTARRMIDSVLGRQFNGTSSIRNFNNHVGLPLSMLGIEPNQHYAVLEMAASAPGEIALLCKLAAPHIGVITRLGEAHLKGFGSIESLAAAKCELLWSLGLDGAAVLCGDDPLMRTAARGFRGKTLWFGRSAECQIMAKNVESKPGELNFQVEEQSYRAPVWGRHHLDSALAAVAVGKLFGLSSATIAQGLAAYEPAPQRCEVTEVAGVSIINDCYNASPTAMRAALELLRDFDASGRRIVIAGDMRELGAETENYHRQLGDEVVTLCGASELIAFGEHAACVAQAARDAGMPAHAVATCETFEQVLQRCELRLQPGDVVLIKGSRALCMEQLVGQLEAALV